MTIQELKYRFTLDAFKNGMQRVLQGFQTGENVARSMEISLMSGSKPYELPLNGITASMYVTRPSDESPSINACTIDAENNKVIYHISAEDIAEAGVVKMQLKLIDIDEVVLISPMFGMEVWESTIEDSEAEDTPTYTALTQALADAIAMKDSAIADLYIDENNIFTVVFGDGTTYTSNVIADAVARIGDVELYALKAEGFAVGKQNNVDVGNDSPYYHNNAKYYSEEASTSAGNAATSETNAGNSETAAAGSATLAESYAKGGTSSRSGEDTDNSKYFKEQSANSATASANSAIASAGSATESQSYAKGGTSSRTGEDTDNAKYYKEQAASQASAASGSATSASASATLAESYAKGGTSSRTGEDTDNSKYYSELAYGYKGDAAQSATNAGTSETNAGLSATAASGSATTAGQKATLSESYAVGGTSTRTGEDTDNAKYYKEQCEQIAAGMAGGLLPMGTVTFAQLPTQNLAAGMMYNISDAFTSDNRFKDGGGKSYPAGTNAYVTADTMWDCFAGALVTVNNKTGQSITLDGSDIKATTYSKAVSKSAIAATDTLNAALGKLEYKADNIVGSEVTMTGYTKAASKSAVATTDKADQAIGKLEYKLDNVLGSEVGLTGYSKAQSKSAIATTDKVDAALGKLEYKVDNIVGSEVTLTGYTKASTQSAISASDTTNQALGKLEKKADDIFDTNTYNIASTDWVANTDSSTNTAYPYIAEITSSDYAATDTPTWEVFGANGIPTATEKDCINMIEYADFGASSGTKIILYANDQPTVALVLKVKGH